MQETEPTSTRSGLRFGKFCSTKLLCVFLTVVLDAAAIPVNDGSSNVMPDVTAIDPMPEPKNSGLLFASPDRHPTFAPRPTPPVPNLKERNERYIGEGYNVVVQGDGYPNEGEWWGSP